MAQHEKGGFESWLAGELLLVTLLGSATALFLTNSSLPEQLHGHRGSPRARRRSCSWPRSWLSSPVFASRSTGGASTCSSRRGSAPRRVETLAFSIVPELGSGSQGAPEGLGGDPGPHPRGDADRRGRLARQRRIDAGAVRSSWRGAGARRPAGGLAAPAELRRRPRGRWVPRTAGQTPEVTVATSFLALLALAARGWLRDPLPQARRGPRQLARAPGRP